MEPNTTNHSSDVGVKYRTIISPAQLRELSRVNGPRAAGHILAEWSAICGAVLLCQRFWSPWLYLATVIWIGARQHALMILAHDAAHYRLFRQRRLNDWVAELLLAWPVLGSARAYRRNHFAHHRFLNTAADPDWMRRQGDPAWVFPRPPAKLLASLLRDLSGLGALPLLRLIARLQSRDTGVSWGFRAARYGFYLAVGVFVVHYDASKSLLLYWFVPLFTWLVFIFHLRSIAEHSALGATRCFGQTRTTLPNLFERLLIAPKNVSYHLEHHLYPSVPFYHLPKLHALLSPTSQFRVAHITHSYLGVFRECVDGQERGFFHRKTRRRRISAAA